MDYPFTLVRAGYFNGDQYPLAKDVSYMEILDFTSSAKAKNFGFAGCDWDGTSDQLPRFQHKVVFANEEVEMAFIGETITVIENNIRIKYALIKRTDKTQGEQ